MSDAGQTVLSPRRMRGGHDMKLIFCAGIAVLGLAEVLAFPSLAAPLQADLTSCFSNGPAEARVGACTSVIEAAPSKAALARALDARGLSLQALGRNEDAVADFSTLIRLVPNVAGYYDNRQSAMP